MADDVDAEAERAANAARKAVKQHASRSSSSVLPLLLAAFAVATAAVLFVTDKPPSSQPSSTVEAPPTPR